MGAITIRRASADEIDEAVAIDDDACALFATRGLHVRAGAMRHGIGRSLLSHAIAWADGDPLWLTTYAHVPWNRAYYEEHGFAVVPESECPSAIVAILDEQRRWLPDPAQRIAMCRR